MKGESSMKLHQQRLGSLTTAIFYAAGCQADEAERVARHLVEANLVGHDSHGVIRVPSYIKWLGTGKVFAGRKLQVVFENDAIAIVDGQLGFGQSIGGQAMPRGIEKSARPGGAAAAPRTPG